MRFARDLLRFVLLFGLIYSAFGVHSPFFPSFLSTRGLAPHEIGTVLALGTAIRLIVSPVAGRLADMFQAGRAILGLCLGAAALLALGYFPASGLWPLLALSLASAVALGPIAPLADSLALDRAARRSEPGGPVFDYGWVRGAGSAAFIAGSLLAGQAISLFGLTVILALQAGLFAAAAFSAFGAPRGEPRSSAEAPTPSEVEGVHGFKRLLSLPLYRRVLVVAALVFGSHAMHDAFAVIRWREAGVGPELTGLLWSESVAAEVIVFFLLGRALLDRLGPARAAALCAAAGVLRWVVMAETAWVPALALVQPLHGLTFALLHLAFMRILAEIVPAGLAATALTLYGTLGSGASSVLMTLVSGPLYGRFGSSGFWVMAGLCLVAVPLSLGLRPNARSS